MLNPSSILDVSTVTSGKFFDAFHSFLSSAEFAASPGFLSQARSVTKISPRPHRAQMASQLVSSRLTVYYRRFCDGRSASEGELLPLGLGSETRRMPWLQLGLVPRETVGSGMRPSMQQEVMCLGARKAVAGITMLGGMKILKIATVIWKQKYLHPNRFQLFFFEYFRFKKITSEVTQTIIFRLIKW